MYLLENLYKIHSQSGEERLMRNFVDSMCRRCGAETWVDDKGNLYALKGEAETYPCVVAHLDQVQHVHSDDFRSIIVDDIILGFSPENKSQEGLGADDKNGIWVALKCLEHFDVLKCAFFVGEEIGCVGSSSAEMEFFDDCRFVIQCDRRGGSDLINNAGGVELCSDEFLLDIGYAEFGYKPTTGLMTDVMTLKERGLKVSCCNLSCGYYEPHTDSEVTSISELQNCLDFVMDIITRCEKVYPHEYNGYYDYYNGSYNGTYFEDETWDVEELMFNYIEWASNPRFSEFWSFYKDCCHGMHKKEVKKMFKQAIEDYDVFSQEDYEDSFYGETYDVRNYN